MTIKHKAYLAMTLLLMGSLLLPAWAGQSVPVMSKEELKAMLSDAQTYVLDVRTGRDWRSSEFKIKDAHRADPGAYGDWSSAYPKTATLVLYCA
jgi:hypothetical protein